MRRYDLDWLRVIVFGLLIFYHVGMFFVPWGFHIKNNVIYDWIRFPMLLLNQWRLPILFVISGMGNWFALGSRSGLGFAWERVKRLFIPLIFGMLVIVPPQVYLERLAHGELSVCYLNFWPQHAFEGIYPEGNLSWHHLWFLPYLLVYSLMLLPVFLYLRTRPHCMFMKWVEAGVSNRFALYLFIIPLYLFEAFLEPFFPVTHSLIDDWFNFINCAYLFFCGFLLMNVQNTFWATIVGNRRFFLRCGVGAFAVWFIIVFSFEDSYIRHFTEALVKVFNIWSWVLVLFAYAAVYLNPGSKSLSYANQAVYPFYILHQSVMMVMAYWIMDLEWSFVPKFIILALWTFSVSWLCYEFVIRRVRFLWPFFGIKSKR